MNSILEDSLREESLVKLYFGTNIGTNNDFFIAGIKRAFLDFCRTLKVKDNNRTKLKEKSENFILKELQGLIGKDLKKQEDFDQLHKEICEGLQEKWNELTIGQSQKWINMTLKYWLLLGNKRIKDIEKNAKFFHIPIDSYVQKGMFNEKNPKTPWSKIEDYKTYFAYQQKYREKNGEDSAIIVEFIFFNNYKPK